MPTIIKNGIQYNVNPNAIGASELTVTTPEVEVIGKAPLFDSRHSAFNGNELLDITGDISNKAIDTTSNAMYAITKPLFKMANPVLRTIFTQSPSYLDSKGTIYNDLLDNGKSRLGMYGLVQDENNKHVWHTKNLDKQCAKVANQLSQVMANRPTAGDAWTTKGIYGDSTIVSGYKLPKMKHYSRFTADLYNRAAAEYVKHNIEDKDIQTGDIVDLYYYKSPKQKIAYKYGYNRMNTHTGRILRTDPYDKSKTFVVHNVNGNVISQPIGDLLGGLGKVGITAIRRPFTKNDKR